MQLGGVEVRTLISSFLVIASCGNISLECVDSKNCTIRFGLGVTWVFDVG